jgi:hypothetical protein
MIWTIGLTFNNAACDEIFGKRHDGQQAASKTLKLNEVFNQLDLSGRAIYHALL